MAKNPLYKSFLFAFQGLFSALSERNFKLHLLSASFAIMLGVYFNIQPFEWLLILICIVLVLGFELLNTALEKLTDLVSPEHHPLAGQAKDMAAAAVLLVSVAAAIIGLYIFIPYFFN